MPNQQTIKDQIKDRIEKDEKTDSYINNYIRGSTSVPGKRSSQFSNANGLVQNKKKKRKYLGNSDRKIIGDKNVEGSKRESWSVSRAIGNDKEVLAKGSRRKNELGNGGLVERDSQRWDTSFGVHGMNLVRGTNSGNEMKLAEDEM